VKAIRELKSVRTMALPSSFECKTQGILHPTPLFPTLERIHNGNTEKAYKIYLA
jgi:hypothetical protein